jgi:hypothetical protein
MEHQWQAQTKLLQIFQHHQESSTVLAIQIPNMTPAVVAVLNDIHVAAAVADVADVADVDDVVEEVHATIMFNNASICSSSSVVVVVVGNMLRMCLWWVQ